MRAVLLALCLSAILTGTALPQSDPDLDALLDAFIDYLGEPDVEITDILGRLDLDVPDSPAFAVLGITPQNVINPDTPAELATAIFLGNDNDGNSHEGLALEFRPYLMARGDAITLADYVNNNWLARAAVSFADTSGVDPADKTDRQALGITFTPIDHRDPLSQWRVGEMSDCLLAAEDQIDAEGEPFRQALRDAIASGDPVSIAEAEAALSEWFNGPRDAFLEAAGANCVRTQNAKYANAQQLQIGLAYHNSEVGALDESGSAIWVSYTRPVGSRGTLIAHGRFSNDMIKPVESNEGSYQLTDELVIGARYRMGDTRRAVLAEVAYKDESVTGGRDDSYAVALIGAEFRVIESLWIQVAFGKTFGSNGDDDPALSGQFRWALSKTRFWRRN